MVPVIDLEHLNRQTLGDRDISVEILRLFVQQMDATLGGLSFEDEDLTDQVHTLKGSARGIGAWQLATIAERFAKPQDCREEDLDDLVAAIQVAKNEASHLLREGF
ncbi:MAG: Hpt domain-containing protein [Cohaesibacter sp.]|jgi:HPt (histidine-containing phosphotransfer) domain-containing protein|nr:Hpt domain-containing protein [Cohaesibacter sp.]